LEAVPKGLGWLWETSLQSGLGRREVGKQRLTAQDGCEIIMEDQWNDEESEG